MKRLTLVLALAVAACGPNRAEQAFQSCQQHMNAKNFEAAESACKLAMNAAPKNDLYRQAYFDAGLARYSAAVARIKAEGERQRALIAAEEQAEAARREANAVAFRDLRVRN